MTCTPKMLTSCAVQLSLKREKERRDDEIYDLVTGKNNNKKKSYTDKDTHISTEGNRNTKRL